ncbi:MAG: hypothetical protein R3E53_10070 [Myxococcota bacterium]
MIGFGRLVRRLSRRSQDTLADTNVFAAEALGFVQTVRRFATRRRAGAAIATSSRVAFNARASAHGGASLASRRS